METPQMAHVANVAPVPTPFPGPSNSLFDEINSLRRARNLPELVKNDALTCAAQKHAWDIGPRNVCTNKGTDGSTFIERVRACQGVATSELVACNYPDAKSAIVGWLQRADAGRILLHPNQVQMGVGEVDRHYVVVFLGM